MQKLGLQRLTAREAGSGHFRRTRFRLFLELLDRVTVAGQTCRVLDIGGEPTYWRTVIDLIGSRKIHIVLVNKDRYPNYEDNVFESIVGDARDLSIFSDLSFDIVHSNSVIEHVGRWPDMQAMAHEVRRLAPSFFVQTPYFWFPLEPHCSTFFFHWLPESVRVSMLMRRPRGVWGQASDVGTAMLQVQSAVLLDYRMLSTLFPDAVIHRERVLGLTKSLVAIRDATVL